MVRVPAFTPLGPLELYKALHAWAAAGLPGTKAVYGIAHAQGRFAEGAERVVYQCNEVLSCDGGEHAVRIGRRLVAKEARFTQQLDDHKCVRRGCQPRPWLNMHWRGVVIVICIE